MTKISVLWHLKVYILETVGFPNIGTSRMTCLISTGTYVKMAMLECCCFMRSSIISSPLHVIVHLCGIYSRQLLGIATLYTNHTLNPNLIPMHKIQIDGYNT